ncbi:MAG TPA: hypothetical protein ENJ95_20410 [Bacteroidetes bacterium]|nr:hypothetical protein [Bacteroidota bacterium]
MEYITAFGIAFGFSFVGMLPPGMLNMKTVGLSLSKGFYAALFFAVGAASVEFFQSLLVIKFADNVAQYLDGNVYVLWAAVAILTALGISFLLSKPKKDAANLEGNALKNKSTFFSGIGMAFMNVLVHPFWLAQGIYWTQQGVLWNGWPILITFSAGIFLGSVACYVLYILLAEKILKKFDVVANNINKILAAIFFVLAAIQLFQIFKIENFV